MAVPLFCWGRSDFCLTTEDYFSDNGDNRLLGCLRCRFYFQAMWTTEDNFSLARLNGVWWSVLPVFSFSCSDSGDDGGQAPAWVSPLQGYILLFTLQNIFQEKSAKPFHLAPSAPCREPPDGMPPAFVNGQTSSAHLPERLSHEQTRPARV